jgi:hypothetical protein
MIMDQLSPAVVSRLQGLILSAQQIIDTTPEDPSPFGDQRNAKARLAKQMFDEYILKRETPLSKHLIAALEKHIPGLPSNPIEAYEIINLPHHDIRNFMIRNEVDLLEEQ